MRQHREKVVQRQAVDAGRHQIRKELYIVKVKVEPAKDNLFHLTFYEDLLSVCVHM